MKTYYFSLCFLLTLALGSLLNAQNQRKAAMDQNVTITNQEDCEDFNAGVGNWQRSNQNGDFNNVFAPTNTTPGPSDSPDDRALDGFDMAGSDYLFNQTDYQGNLLSRGECLCFDFKVLNSGTSEKIYPAIYFYKGDMTASPRNHVYSAVFTFNVFLDANDDWIRLCAPIKPESDGSYPTSSDGYWQTYGGTATSFSDLVTNADGIFFNLDRNNWPMEKYAFDNICFDCPPTGNHPEIGAYCCDESDNLIENGNFEQGNVGFSSDYSQNASTYPGQYNVSSSAAQFGINITDHSYCVDPVKYAANNKYLLVNGLTNNCFFGPRSIYSQDVPIEPNKDYKFCMNLKNMPQCTFDVIPEIMVEINGNVVIPYTQINTDPNNPCDWMSLSHCVSELEGDIASIRVYLQGSPLGDGNDLAIDDISFQEMKDPDYKLTVVHDGGANHIKASVSPYPLLNEDCDDTDEDYHWFVYETYDPTAPLWGAPIPGTEAYGNATSSWGYGASGAPWGLPSTNFPNYPFENNKFYVIGIYVPGCCDSCYKDGWAYQITYNYSSKQYPNFELTDEIKEIIKSNFNRPGNTSNFESAEELQMQVIPNPNSGEFSVKTNITGSGVLNLYDINGKQIYSENFQDKDFFDIKITQKPQGVYVLKLQTNDGKSKTAQVLIK